MQALRTQTVIPGFLSKPHRSIRYYLDGKRVSRDAYADCFYFGEG